MNAACMVVRESGVREELKLAMQRLWLTGRVYPVGAHLVVKHEFVSSEEKPLEVVYSFMLPRDAAMRRFRVEGEHFRAESELRPKADARKAYEEGMAQGSLSTLAEQHQDGVVNLSLGNLRPGERVLVSLEIVAGVELHDDGLRFRFPFTIAPAYHKQARTIGVPGQWMEQELPRDLFGDVMLPRLLRDASTLHGCGFDLEIQGGDVSSPSHPMAYRKGRATLVPERDVPDRDLILDLQREDTKSIQALAGDDAGRRRFAIAVPSAYFGEAADGAKRVAILLDRSGSMEGSPMQQAKKSVEACLASLTPGDQFGIVAFDNRNEFFADKLKSGDKENRAAAAQFLQGIAARGGTELAGGVEAAAGLLGGPGGSIFILTDGQVHGTDAIIRKAKQTGTRLFCLGIGSASQDRFLSLLASQTGGVSRFVSPRERVDVSAVDLFASVDQPVAKDVRVNGMLQSGAVFANSPLIVFGTADAAGSTLSLALEWDNQHRPAQSVAFVPADAEVVRLFEGARRIAAGENVGAQYGLADETMSLVAVIKREGDKPGELPTTIVVPVGLAQDVNMGGYVGSAPTGQFLAMFAAPPPMPSAPSPVAMRMFDRVSSPSGFLAKAASAVFGNLTQAQGPPALPLPPAPAPAANIPIELATRIDADGGMPGATPAKRIERTIAAILYFEREGSTAASGPFRNHVKRLYAFLKANGWNGKLELAGDLDAAIKAALQ